MRLHLPSFTEVTSRSDRICPVEPGRHSEQQITEVRLTDVRHHDIHGIDVVLEQSGAPFKMGHKECLCYYPICG